MSLTYRGSKSNTANDYKGIVVYHMYDSPPPCHVSGGLVTFMSCHVINTFL